MSFLAQHISKSIRGKQILTDCSVCIRPGRLTAIVGANGAGKSTLFKILSREMTANTGSLRLNQHPLSRYSSRALSQVRAVLPQQTVVNFPFTVEQVIEIGRYVHPTNSLENQQIIEEVMALTKLTGFRNRAYQTLSGGEQQRVQMARVMGQIWEQGSNPKYLLLDEPTSSLDLAQQHTLLSLAKRLCMRSVGVLAILHDLNLAIQYADEILFLKKGEVIAYGDVTEVITQAVIEETFSHPVRLLEENGMPVVLPVPAQQQWQTVLPDYSVL